MTGYKAHALLIGMPTCSRSFAGLPVTEGSGINETSFFFSPVRLSCKIHREHQPLFSKANQGSSVPICTCRQLCKLVLFPPTPAIPVTWCLRCFIRQIQQRQSLEMDSPSFQTKGEPFIFPFIAKAIKLLSKRRVEVHPWARRGFRVFSNVSFSSTGLGASLWIPEISWEKSKMTLPPSPLIGSHPIGTEYHVPRQLPSGTVIF